MDNSTFREFNLNLRNRVSPYQISIQKAHKAKITETYKNQMWAIWALPLGLTFTEIILLKHEKVSGANRVALAKWIAIILAGVATNYATNECMRKLNYFDVVYRRPTKMQLEQLREYEVSKQFSQI